MVRWPPTLALVCLLSSVAASGLASAKSSGSGLSFLEDAPQHVAAKALLALSTSAADNSSARESDDAAEECDLQQKSVNLCVGHCSSLLCFVLTP